MKPLPELTDDELGDLLRRAVALPDAPASAVQAAMRLWPRTQAPGFATLARGAVQRIVASLSFDSWAAPAFAAGLRGAATETRQLLFTANGRDIDVRVTPEAAHFTIAGQVLGPDEAGSVELLPANGGADPTSAVHLDDLGEFRIENVPPGMYTLMLRLPDADIELPGLELAERRV